MAAVLILFSFSAGMVLYHQVLQSSWSAVQMTAVFEQGYLADSLARAPELVDQEILREEIRYEIVLLEEERFEGLLQLRIAAYDRSGKLLCELDRLIDKGEQHDENEH